MNSGIYIIGSSVNERIYIGSAIDLRIREKNHFVKLRNGKHPNNHLQSAWNKYGEDKFYFKHIFYCDSKNLLFYEQRAIDFYDKKYLYNQCPIAGSVLGIKRPNRKPFSLETRRKLSETTKRMWESESIRNKIIQKRLGRKVSEETKAKISSTLKGHSVSDETRIRLIESHKGKPSPKKGIPTKPHSEEHNMKISESMKLYRRNLQEAVNAV
jgi:group I intron endonuclease